MARGSRVGLTHVSDSWLAVGWGQKGLCILTSSRLAQTSSQEESHRVPESPSVLAYLLPALVCIIFVNILLIC